MVFDNKIVIARHLKNKGLQTYNFFLDVNIEIVRSNTK